MKITLYPPNGTAQEFIDCELNGSLMPELEFVGRQVFSGYYPVHKEVKRYITTLAYTIEHEVETTSEQLSRDSSTAYTERLLDNSRKAPIEGSDPGSDESDLGPSFGSGVEY